MASLDRRRPSPGQVAAVFPGGDPVRRPQPSAAPQGPRPPARPAGRGHRRRAFSALDRTPGLDRTFRPGHARTQPGAPGPAPPTPGTEPVGGDAARTEQPQAPAGNTQAAPAAGPPADTGSGRTPLAAGDRAGKPQPGHPRGRLQPGPAALRWALQPDRQPDPPGPGIPDDRWHLYPCQDRKS